MFQTCNWCLVYTGLYNASSDWPELCSRRCCCTSGSRRCRSTRCSRSGCPPTGGTCRGYTGRSKGPPRNAASNKQPSTTLIKTNTTRMHSSRMRTGRSLTVCRSLLPGGGVSAAGGVCSGGCLLPGVASLLPGGGIPACTEADPPVNRMTNRCKNITLATTSLRPVNIK